MSASPIIANFATFVVGTFVFFLICAFVSFAVLRVVTGISIQRPGYLSFKRISFEPKAGLKLEVRKLGLLLHRPTFAQPTWVTIVVQDSHVTVDLRLKGGGAAEEGGGDAKGDKNAAGKGGQGAPALAEEADENMAGERKNKLMLRLKEKLQKAHKWLQWISLVDVAITNTTVTIADVGSIQVGSLTLMVDTKRGAANRNPMFDHCTDLNEGARPIEWILGTKSVLLLTTREEPVELLDHASVNVYGVVAKGLDGLRDLAVAFKLGRVTLPVDDLLTFSSKLKVVKADLKKKKEVITTNDSKAPLGALTEEVFLPGSRTQRVTEAVMDNRELLHSLLEGVKGIQFAIGHLVVSKEIPNIQPAGRPLQVSLGLKELWMDVHQLDRKSAAHRMYFSPSDIAHQALLAAISVTISLNDGVRQDKIAYIPMVTMTSRTTLFSKTIQIMESLESDRNANILSANVVVTSPAIDLQPRHLPLLVAFSQSRPKRAPSSGGGGRAHIISRLLPKASVKLSIQEPVMRITLPPTEPESQDMDMLVSSLSSISVDLEASHEAEGQARYSLDAALRVTSHNFYYRAACGMRHDLMQTETFDLKAEVNASPEVQVVVYAYISSFALTLARPEIVEGIKQMVSQFHSDYKPDKIRRPQSSESRNFLRQIPLWLEHFKLECNDFSIEVAGIDTQISEFTRGAALQMDSWTIDYKCKKGGEQSYRTAQRRRTTSRTLSKSEELKKPLSSKSVSGKNPTDGRKLSLHIRGLEGFMVDGLESWEEQPFLQIPHFDLGFSTMNDAEGPVLHISSFSKSLYINYSLYRHYCIFVAAKIIKEAFCGVGKKSGKNSESQRRSPDDSSFQRRDFGDMDMLDSPVGDSNAEFVSVDIKLQYVQVKASMPDDPPMMLEINQLDTGRHRWGFPFLKAKHFRLYAESPRVENAWARIISLRNFRLDLREIRKKSERTIIEEKSIDLSADAVRLAIPHQLILYKITDNIVNTMKASQQMHHRFKTGTKEYILEKGPEAAKIIPKISLKTKALLLELEDDPFETKLGLIYRVGLSEQKKRLAREAAFEAKVKKMEQHQHTKSPETNRLPVDSSKQRGRSRTWRHDTFRPANLRSHTQTARSKSSQPAVKNMRYDPESAAGPSESASVSIQEAWERLQELNSVAWIKRIRLARDQQQTRMSEAREMLWGHDDMPTDSAEGETILGLPMRPALMSAFFNDVSITVDKPSFPLSQLPKFLHRVGKGLPEDTQFALLVPLSLKLTFNEGKLLLRDYPLPFVHIPHPRVGQRSPSWILQADFVVAEEYRGNESMRHAQVNIIPPSKAEYGGFAIDVRRTVSPVKSYSDIKVSINTSYSTRICWCTAYQPAIQDMMVVFETFSKPHVDPSERTGFWDKIRLILHSQLTLAWEGDGDVHLALKGSRDPYMLTGDGAGFVMCWRGNVRWHLGRDEDPRKLLKVDSAEYILAIPDYTNHVFEDIDMGGIPENRSINSTNSSENAVQFQKVIMKLSGPVRWLVGLMFEQEITQEDDWKQRKRSSEFIPHYKVTLKSLEYAKAPPGEVYDAFRGFRSHHIHMSLAIVSPIDRDPTNMGSPTSYNTIHLTPKFFTHFFSWWSLFSGVMSLPVRQGALWPGPEKSTKKFGRHLATIKYKLCLSPLFISHIYKYYDKDDAGNDIIAATGLKAKLDALLLDIHMRREESLVIPGSTTMKINQAELDFHSADIRAVHAVTPGDTLQELMNQTADVLDDMAETIRYTGDMSQFTIADGDYTWVDMDDFVELDWALNRNKTPKTQIMPLAYAPRFTYFRQTDHSVPESDMASPMSPFGNEATHDCIMSLNNDPREIQCALVQARLERVNEQMSLNKEAIEHLAKHIRMYPEDLDLKESSEKLIQQSSVLFNMRAFLETMLRRISSRLDEAEKRNGAELDPEDSNADSEMLGVDASTFADYVSDFDNRFIVHNMQAKWSNTLRNIIFKYIHQVGQRQGFTYYMSRRAIKFILDMIEEQKNSDQSSSSGRTEFTARGPCNTEELNDMATLESRIQQLLDDEVKVVVADERPSVAPALDQVATMLARDNLGGDVAEDYVPQNSFHVRLIAPQIQLQSDKNPGAAVLVVAQGMQLKIVSIMDRDRLGDEVSGLVQRRFALNLENTQFFVSHHKDFATESMSLHSENRYGAPNGSSWPPWVPLESMFDFRQTPVGFSRAVERTSATLRYDKHNTLRLKYSDQVSGIEAGKAGTKHGPLEAERRIDHVWVDFPRVEASCDSNQYFAIYIIIMDLLLYSEPAQKVRSEKLEKIMLASDFSDLTGAPEMVECLQSRIRQLNEIKSHFMLNAQSLDIEGWKGKYAVEEDLANCEEELFFMMKAITTAQRKYEDRSAQASGIVRWYITASEIIWHMLKDRHEPLMDVRLQKAAFERMDNADGSNHNTFEVEMLRGFNLLPGATYPEMIAPFIDHPSHQEPAVRHAKVLRVYWNMLEAIAGIPVMDHFEVNLFPLKIQLEREIGEKIFEYIFPEAGKGAFEDSGFSPFLVNSMKPFSDKAAEESESELEAIRIEEPQLVVDDSSSTKSDASLGMDRLRPTTSLGQDRRPPIAPSELPRPKTSSSASFFGNYRTKPQTLSRKASHDELSLMSRRSSDGPAPSIYAVDSKKKMQFFGRASANDRDDNYDELSQMMSRASNYMTLAYVKIPSVVLCLSYKGRGDKNIEDIHELVFKMPMLEYRNRTWSNLDLAMHLKKDIIRALISHTGAIIQNKLTHHRPDKPKDNLFRMMANNSALGTTPTTRPGTSHSNYPHESFALPRPSTAYSTASRSTPSILRSDAASISGVSAFSRRSDPTEDEGGLFANALGRHFTNLTMVSARFGNGNGTAKEEETEERFTSPPPCFFFFLFSFCACCVLTILKVVSRRRVDCF
ncbi:golgi-body localization protein domain-containing protein [Sphaerosporella brunnea]|uniref:Golgi-body localization protein domain-containing protein n=1 Tax=Sphaerosporella brunnea TaxID=1250544 RepID=A0A5J5EQ00_9PEZI|nr:golgi-body localization protein domain-containing protein [Sphaerosporella brunnea]